MQTITFTCETITPMFLSGADGSTPELRAPSIKGALRFWWRAMNGHLGLEELKEREGQIFGDTKRRSKVIIQSPIITKIHDVHKISVTPHKNGGEKQPIMYDFNLNLRFDENTISKNDLIFLFKVTFLLGGLGKRSRRGFGAVNIKLAQENTYLFPNKKSVEDFLKSNDFLLKTNPTNTIDYPFIKETILGVQMNKILTQIGTQTHKFYKYTVYSLGFARKEKVREKNKIVEKNCRMASPVYISAFLDSETKKIYPIITWLYTAFQSDLINIPNCEDTKAADIKVASDFIQSLINK